jgi:ABC-type polysaccharide/polyol phosphate export permease
MANVGSTPPPARRRQLTERDRIKNVNPTLRAAFQRAWLDRELFVSFVQRDLRARYRRSVIGWGWSMINPMMTALVYSFVFTVFFRVAPTPGDPSGMKSYAFLLLAGSLPWSMMQGGVFGGIGVLIGGGGMIQKVYFAREHLVGGVVYGLVASFLIELTVLASLELLWGQFVFHMAPLLVVLVFLLSLFTMGIALFLSALNLRYRDVQHISGVGFLVWFYLTPILYPVTLIPERFEILGIDLPLRRIFQFNPMARFVQAFRNCLYDVRTPGINTFLGLFVMSVVTFLLGYRYFVRRAPWFVEEL